MIAHLLVEHDYLTTEQVARILFTATRTCRNRLEVLRRCGWVDYVNPVRATGGRLGRHWIAAPLAARYVALAHGQRPPTARTVWQAQDRLLTTAAYIPHRDGVHDFFTALLARSRTHPGDRLLRWWSSATTSAEINLGVRPDGHGVWSSGDRTVAFLLEHDTGTESLSVLTGKVIRYLRMQEANQLTWPLLFWLPSPARERHLHDRLAGLPLRAVIATANRADAAAAGPAGPVWWQVGTDHRQLLADLPGDDGEPSPFQPPPPQPDDDPLNPIGFDDPAHWHTSGGAVGDTNG